MKLKTLLKDVEVLSQYDGDREVSKISVLSNEADESSLFIAVKGEKSNGESLISEAKQKGAVTLGESGADITVKDAKEARALIWRNFYKRPDEKLSVFGVTGTNGKTTVTYLTRHIFEYAGNKTGVIGTVANVIGTESAAAIQTTPAPNELYRLFSKMVSNKLSRVCMEVSSHSLEQKRIHGVTFTASAFTNLTGDHLDYHGNMESYLEAKLKIIERSKSIAINADDAYAKAFSERAACNSIPVLCYGINSKTADLTAKSLNLTKEKSEFTLCYNGEKIRTYISVPGKFSVYNALCAVALSMLGGISIADAAEALKTSGGIKGRMERVKAKNGATAVIDYAHTPDGLKNVLITLNGIKENGRLITVFGCGGDRDKSKRSVMGEIAAKYSDLVIITSDNPRSEDPHAIIRDITVGSSRYKTPQLIIEDRRAAIKTAMQNAKNGDIVLLAGKGHENYQILKDRTVSFDEYEILKAYI
ncbi:MAG: UDP-N-acetylmuramoyl-L-alanyl-D-glutamate--2,6-diaminopimelate ligase [Clostridia bacterium]|nr:UDP-N-acetylmuramoyl-L-alanyl-D-glutamate--2,6-diaminopimelate ligase [Clostridia bacterium]